MKTEGFFFQERIYFHCRKGLFFQNKGMKTVKIFIGMKRHIFFKGAFFCFATIIKKYSFPLRYKSRIFAINRGFTSVPSSWYMEWSNTIELFFCGMSCLQYISFQVLNLVQVIQSNLWTCEIALWTAVKPPHSAFAQAGVPLNNEAQSNQHPYTLVVFRCQ